MVQPLFRSPAREVRDFYGRRYRVGESDRELLGRPRSRVLWAACAVMPVASVGQYAYAALMPALAAVHGWSPAQCCWVLALWTVCQSAVVYPAARVRARLGVPAAAPVLLGAVLCGTGLVALGGSGSLLVVALDFGLLGGTGAGLIYGACLGSVARWYPERPVPTSLVSGSFAAGSVPFVLLAGRTADAGDLVLCTGLAAAILPLVAGVAALLLREPPAHWWPARVDPRAWALDKALNPALRRNRPALRSFSPAEVLRCPASRVLFAVMTLATTVALFDTAHLVVFALGRGLSPGQATVALAVFAAASGTARVGAGWAGDRFGRLVATRVALYAGAAAQPLLLAGGQHRDAWLVLGAAAVAGASAGACFALLPGLVEGHFGERPGLPNFALFYAAKAAGGLLGIALAGYLATWFGYPPVFAAVAVVGLVGAVVAGTLRQPGRPRLPLPGGPWR